MERTGRTILKKEDLRGFLHAMDFFKGLGLFSGFFFTGSEFLKRLFHFRGFSRIFSQDVEFLKGYIFMTRTRIVYTFSRT